MISWPFLKYSFSRIQYIASCSVPLLFPFSVHVRKVRRLWFRALLQISNLDIWYLANSILFTGQSFMMLSLSPLSTQLRFERFVRFRDPSVQMMASFMSKLSYSSLSSFYLHHSRRFRFYERRFFCPMFN